MKKIFLIILLSSLSISLFSQEKYFKNISETQNFSKQIVSLFKENKISQSFEELTPYWPMPENEIESIEGQTIKYLNLIEQRFGKSIGEFKVKNETISDFAVRETYIIRYSNSAIRLIFTYYKNEQGFILNAFKWDDSFTEEFK